MNSKKFINRNYNGISHAILFLTGRHAPDGNDFIILTKAGKTFIKDSENNYLLPIGYSDIVYDGKTGFTLTGNDNFRSYYYSNRRLVAPKYTDIKVVPGSDYYRLKLLRVSLDISIQRVKNIL